MQQQQYDGIDQKDNTPLYRGTAPQIQAQQLKQVGTAKQIDIPGLGTVGSQLREALTETVSLVEQLSNYFGLPFIASVETHEGPGFIPALANATSYLFSVNFHLRGLVEKLNS